MKNLKQNTFLKRKVMMIYKCFLITILLVISTLNSKSQIPYSNYLDYTTEWYYLHAGVFGFEVFYYFRTIYIDGDTVINNQSYFKQYYVQKDSVFSSLVPGPAVVTTKGPVFLKAIREDSMKRFYRFDTNFASEELVIDFNLRINDTFLNNSCTVYKIDTVYFGSIPLKRFQPEYLHIGQGVIEGIGNTGRPICGIGYEANTVLVCFHKQNNWMHLDTSSSCNSFLKPKINYNNASKLKKSGNSIKLFPNPASKSLMIESTKHRLAKCLIYNNIGAIIFQINLGMKYEKIDISKLKNGFYIVHVIDDKNMSLTSKFVKQ